MAQQSTTARICLMAAVALCTLALSPAQATSPLHNGAVLSGGEIEKVALSQFAGAPDQPQLSFSVPEMRNVALPHALQTSTGVIPAGRRVSSHLVALRPSEIGSISFHTPILAILTSDEDIAQTNLTLGRLDLDYTPLHGLTTTSANTLAAEGKVLRYDASAAADDLVIVRVITAAVPEPGTWAMLIAGFGLVGGQMRRRRASQMPCATQA